MIISPLCFNSILKILGLTSLSAWLGSLVGLLFVLYLMWIGASIRSKRKSATLRRLSWTTRVALARLRESTRKETGAEVVRDMQRKMPPLGFARIWAMLSVLIIVALSGASTMLAVHDNRKIHALEAELAKYRTATVVEHNVVFLSQLKDGDFAYKSDEEPDGGAYRPCRADMMNGLDVTGILSQAIGYVAEHTKWEERGVCKSILRSDLGFWWVDSNTDFKPRRIN
jgi:hypothetical protein